MRLEICVDGPADAPALLFINSIGCEQAMWDAQAAALAGRFRVIRYDARGHGGSTTPPGDYRLADLGRDALTVLDAASVERAHVCGLSLGGLTAQWLAIHAPERVERLVLASTAARIGTAQGWRERIELVRHGGMDGVAELALGRFFCERFRLGHPQAAAAVRDQLLRTRVDGYAGCCAALRDADLCGEICSIVAPTLVMAGALDVSTPRSQGEALARGLKHARLQVLDAAHLSNIERPGEFTAALRDHLEAA
jgi:3-oxoadipate enol-lactonase